MGQRGWGRAREQRPWGAVRARSGGGAAGLLGLPDLERSRHQHTCTALEDGSVLIAGGLEEDGVQRTTLDDLLLYMPVPLD
ncbi:Kelch repeat-containing protein [Cystobacter fuscus]